MIPRVSLVVLAATLAAGCTGKDEEGETGDSAVIDTSVAPVVASVDSVECTMQQSAGELWVIGLTVTDPQGDDTVADGSLAVLDADGNTLASYVVACNEGTCSASFRADYDGIGCAMIDTITFSLVVVDEQGNSSAAFGYDPSE